MKIVSKVEMAKADSVTINTLGLSGENLMENAAQAITERFIKVFGKDKHVLVLCGVGNNGGDGIAIARRLINLGYNVSLWLIPPENLIRGEAKIHLDIYKRHGYNIQGYSDEIYSAVKEADVIVDALLGNGVSGTPRKPYDSIILAINNSSARVVSVDIPSGINADSSHGDIAVMADITYMIQCAKCSCFLYPAAKHYGNWEVVDIGIPDSALEKPFRQLWTHDEYKSTSVKRYTDSHKGSNGKALIAGGSSHMIGAPILSASACFSGGIGLLSSAVPYHVMTVLAAIRPESTFAECEEDRGNLISIHIPEQIDVIAVGMGLSRADTGRKLVEDILENDAAVVADGDALHFLPYLWERVDRRGADTIVTPHMGEMAHLCGIPLEQVENDRFGVSRKLALQHGLYVVLKGPYTIVTTPQGDQFVNTSGNSGLAKGGSGDVLTGLIAGLLPRFDNTQHAISNAVYLHGNAADMLLEQGYGIDRITPSNIISQLSFME